LHPKDLTLQVIGTCAGAGVDNAWEQKKLEARKMLVNRAESPPSTARFVGTLLTLRLTYAVTGFISRQRG
ncbi:MAG TPA: hypothetical protein PKC99_17920, partial [Anaerolineales bacterium]|nr:hypothetical protein [Anaerolineales bacterium]